MSSQQLIALLRETRDRQLGLFLPIVGEDLLGHPAHHDEPPIWEMGHVAWFQELYILRGLDKRAPILPRADGMYDSFKVSYKRRWSHDFPDKEETLRYAAQILEACTARLANRNPNPEEEYIYRLIADHESMHSENLAAMRCKLDYPFADASADTAEVDARYQPRDVHVAGGLFPLGASPEQGFVLDNERQQHIVEVAPFYISTTAVTNAQYMEFVDADGYSTRSLWDKDGWNWRRRSHIDRPLYWQREGGLWHRQQYGKLNAVEPWHAMSHVNLHEARAYCRFAQRRLPTEAEWEMAASWDPITKIKRIYPWGNTPPTAQQVHMGKGCSGPTDVRANAAGDSPVGCRQMIGNVWEWTSSKLDPYPGFEPGPYREYSLPYLGKKPVLRGGAWATSPGLIRNTWRNFFMKHRRNIFAGIRTCAL